MKSTTTSRPIPIRGVPYRQHIDVDDVDEHDDVDGGVGPTFSSASPSRGWGSSWFPPISSLSVSSSSVRQDPPPYSSSSLSSSNKILGPFLSRIHSLEGIPGRAGIHSSPENNNNNNNNNNNSRRRSKWSCPSPMTHPMLFVDRLPPPPSQPLTPSSSLLPHLPRSHRKRRSQSFSDYMEQRQQHPHPQQEQRRRQPPPPPHHHHHHHPPQQQQQQQQELEDDDEPNDWMSRSRMQVSSSTTTLSSSAPIRRTSPLLHSMMIPPPTNPPLRISSPSASLEDMALQPQLQLQQQDYLSWQGVASNDHTHDATPNDYDISDQLPLSLPETASYHSLTFPPPPPTPEHFYEDDSFEKENEGDDATTPLPPPTSVPSADPSPSFLIHILYGMINATIVIPVVMSFGAIIYQDPFFGPYAPVLIQLTMVSGVVHQLCFSTLSALPFAVGSVQDAGLIFLSGMATSMVRYCRSHDNVDVDDTVLLATVTVGLGLASLLLGCGLILVGKLQLAGYVQLLPTCVVAGYLAYIGFFCGKAGLGLMAIVDNDDDDDDDTELSLSLLIRHWKYVLPGIVGGIFIYGSVRTFRHVAVLPTCILILFLGFYTGLLFVAQSSVSEATQGGWIRQSEPAPVWYKTWDYLQLDKVVWSAFPQLALSEISMLFVVALSSSLDVAAIQLELANNSLDYNKELTMVGISNVISGATGGYTGSYIFSQSIFSLRSGITSRVAGFSLAACQILVILTPFPLLSFVPNCFYGSLLTMICLDLMIEWLWTFRTHVTTAEYIIGLSTFGMIQWLGVEYGILAGVGIYVVCRHLLGIPVVVVEGDDRRTDKVDDDNDDDDDDTGVREDNGARRTSGHNKKSSVVVKETVVNETTPLTVNTDSCGRRNE